MSKLSKQIHYSNAALAWRAKKIPKTSLSNSLDDDDDDNYEDIIEEGEEDIIAYQEDATDNNNIYYNNENIIVDDVSSSEDDEETPNMIFSMIEMMNSERKKFKVPFDHNHPVSNGGNLTVGEFANQMQLGFSELKVTNAQELFFFKLINAAFPASNLPVKRDSHNNIVKSRLSSYVYPSNRMLKFDSCRNGCVVFTLELSELIRCPKCNKQRFYNCKHKSCRHKSYDECPHGVNSIYKTAKKLLFYRPILQTLKELLKKPGFLLALNYKFIKSIDSNYEDVQDGANYKKHENEMNRIFNIRNEKEKEKKLIKVNVLISQFYDGVQIYNKKVADFWPLLFTILNLPPNIRNKIGYGMFLLSVFSAPQGCQAEKFLFENCFILELKSLQKGVIITQGKHNFFVQVRIIQHCMDTKAIGKELHVQEVNSLIGCPFCRGFYGTYRHDLNKTVYGGNRGALPQNHFFRFIGQSQVCCPPNYYNNFDNIDNNIEFFNNIKTNKLDSIKTGKREKNIIKSNRLIKVNDQICSCIDKTFENNEAIKKFYLDDNTEYIWFHPVLKFDMPKFARNTLYFTHCDLRPQILIKRRTHIEFIRDGFEARNSNNKIVVNGVKDVWIFDQLGYADIEYDFCFDGFHCLYGILKQTFKLFMGSSSTNKETKKIKNRSVALSNFCKKSKILPFLWTKWSKKTKTWVEAEYRAPWILTEKQKKKVDAWMNAILIPRTYSNQFQVKNCFKQFGHLRGNSFIVLFTVAINFMIIALPDKMDIRYKLIISMLGSDISELLSPSINSEDIDLLHFKIIETVCAFEGLFSEKECNFIVHEIFHLAHHIHQMGPLHGWWTFSGERAMGCIKQFVKKGGRSFDKTTLNKYDKWENAITSKKAFHKIFLDNENNITLSLNESFNQLEYDNNNFLLLNKCKMDKNCSFSQVESIFFLDCLLSEVYKMSQDYDDAYERSSFFRLHTYYENLLGSKQCFILDNTNITSFKDFLYVAYSISIKNNGEHNNININENITLSKEEISTVKSLCLFLTYQTNFNIHKNAIIYGLRFSARGFEYRESENPISDNCHYGKQGNFFRMNNRKNNINEFHNWSTQYSCWCRYKINKNKFENDSPSFYYGQLNYFFRFYCETDSLLNGLLIANLVPRSFLDANTPQNLLGVDKIPCEKLFKNISKRRNRNWFVPLTNFVPTAILIVPFDSDDKPIYLNNKEESISTDEMKFYSTNNQINYILAFDLQPNRKCSTFNKLKQKRYNKFSAKETEEIDDYENEYLL
jgi:hypothetical protein